MDMLVDLKNGGGGLFFANVLPGFQNFVSPSDFDFCFSHPFDEKTTFKRTVSDLQIIAKTVQSSHIPHVSSVTNILH